MKTVSHVLLALVLSAVSPSFCEEGSVVVQIALYPYYHDPASAWKLTIQGDGTVSYEESAEPVKLAVISKDDAIRWVSRPGRATERLSPTKQGKLLGRLRALDLGTLRSDYSAQYSYADPTTESRVINESGESHTTAAEVTRVVTHGATYRLRVILDGTSVDSVVYAPFSALEWKDPEHPDRAAISKIIAAWYYVLKAVGPVNEFKPRMFRAGRK